MMQDCMGLIKVMKLGLIKVKKAKPKWRIHIGCVAKVFRMFGACKKLKSQTQIGHGTKVTSKHEEILVLQGLTSQHTPKPPRIWKITFN